LTDPSVDGLLITDPTKFEKQLKELHMAPEKLASMIDHTKLSPDKTASSIETLCDEAKAYGFASVCVNPYWVPLVSRRLQGSTVKVCTVISFPLGSTLPEAKVGEARLAAEAGASELDMVMNIGAMRDGKHDVVENDIRGVVNLARQKGALVKVILEVGYLTDEQVRQACEIAEAAGADFVKTATGFGPMGATIHHVRIMRETVGERMGVKAAGGIRNFKDVLRMIAAGASRIGTSAGVEIMEGYRWAELSEAWTDIEEIPCKLCPVRAADSAKMPKDVYSYYKSKCHECAYKDTYNRFYWR